LKKLRFEVQRLSALSCAKTAELIKMQFGMLGQVGLGTCITRNVNAAMERGIFGGVWLIEKQCKAYDFG